MLLVYIQTKQKKRNKYLKLEVSHISQARVSHIPFYRVVSFHWLGRTTTIHITIPNKQNRTTTHQRQPIKQARRY